MKHLYTRLFAFSFSSTLSFAILLCSFFFFSDVGAGYAQVAGGNITFKTADGSEALDISVVATDLFDGGDNVYNLSGKTNSAISFSSWALKVVRWLLMTISLLKMGMWSIIILGLLLMLLLLLKM